MLIVPSLGTTFQTEHNYGIVHQFYDVLIMGNGLWFLMAFFIAEIIMYGLTEIAQSRVAQLSIGSILIIASFSLGILKLVTWVPFQIVKGIQIAGFMLIGLALRNLLLHMKRTVAIIIVVFAIAIVTTSQALITFGIINKSSTVSIYIAVVIIAAIAGAFGFTCMAIVIKHNSWLSYIGRNSLVYYALNAVTLNVVKFGLFRALHIDATALSFVPQFCIGVIATALAVLLLTIENIFVQRWMWWSIGKQRE